jgi:hypothetical protein
MTKSETPDEKPRKKVAEDVVTAKRQYFVPKYNRSVEAETAKDAVSAAKEEAKKSEDGDA